MSINITVWNEFIHERDKPEVAKVYPDGIHITIADGLREQLGDQVEVRTAVLDQPDHGLPDDVLNSSDVLFWWGHAAHDQVDDALVERIAQRVLGGMGLIVLHSGHDSKPFKRLMGTNCQLRWREEGELERLWIVDPGHPIVDGLDAEYFELPQTEMYGEQFGIPTPDELIMISWFDGGEVFRSACTWRRGKGKIFYFRPGHETYPIYLDLNVRRILANAAVWANPAGVAWISESRNPPRM
jgi:trehalose utilization protein